MKRLETKLYKKLYDLKMLIEELHDEGCEFDTLEDLEEAVNETIGEMELQGF